MLSFVYMMKFKCIDCSAIITRDTALGRPPLRCSECKSTRRLSPTPKCVGCGVELARKVTGGQAKRCYKCNTLHRREYLRRKQREHRAKAALPKPVERRITRAHAN